MSDEKQPSYNCPTCRWRCHPEMAAKMTVCGTMHCNFHEPMSDEKLWGELVCSDCGYSKCRKELYTRFEQPEAPTPCHGCFRNPLLRDRFEKRRCYDEKSCENCGHQVGRLNPRPECERYDDMDCVLNGRCNWIPRSDGEKR